MSGDTAPLPVIFLMGPTATGKSAVAMALAEQLPVDLISVDSTQVYRGLDIGSAKATADELARFPQRLIDIRDPADIYSAADFYRDAVREITAIHASGRIPLLVGGTMLYFRVLLDGLADMPPAVPELRADLEDRAAKSGWPALHRELASVDPETAARLHPNHSHRILRALEVYYASGESMSSLQRRQTERPSRRAGLGLKPLQMALLPRHRRVLHDAVRRRFLQMLDRGFEAEVRALHRREDLSADLPAIRAVGYRQMWGYLEGQLSWEQMIERGIAATRQLAKRQLTWLRGWPELREIYIDTPAGDARQITDICEDALNCVERITI